MQQSHLRRPKLILASGSPRRRELLAQAGYLFEVVPPGDGAEDGNGSGEAPTQLVARLARQKAADVAARYPQGLFLGCDTVVECQAQILGKPDDRQHARRMLECLSGQEHRVYSGLCLWERPADRQLVRVAATRLVMQPLTNAQLEEYLDCGQWQGKAGAFGYQDGHDWLRILEGSESNVVGLPLELLAAMLEELT
jgi:septum formation protein